MADKDEYFFRQRRNLIIMSLLVIFSTAGELRIENNKINLLGTVIQVEHPVMIIIGLWMFFFYFLWRYYTYCSDIGGTGKFKLVRVQWLMGVCDKRAAGKLHKLTGLGQGQLNYTKSVQDSWDQVKRISYVSKYAVQETNGNFIHKKEEVIIKGFEIFSLKMRATLHTAFHSKTFSEYVLPYVLAYIAVAVLLWALVWRI